MYFLGYGRAVFSPVLHAREVRKDAGGPVDLLEAFGHRARLEGVDALVHDVTIPHLLVLGPREPVFKRAA
jgi:hypothetical protein